MQSKAEQILDAWLSNLRHEIMSVEEDIRPFEYTTQGQVAMGREVTKRHIKMTIFGNAVQISICLFMAFYMFPHRSLSIMAFSAYLGCLFGWYVLGRRRFKKKWDLIERLEREADEWTLNLKSNEEYLERIRPIIDQHRKLFVLNNYHSIKDLLVNQNTNTEDGKHFFLTKSALDKSVFASESTISHIDLVLATNSVAKKRILVADKEAWTADSIGSANLVVSPISDRFLLSLDETISKLIESVHKITNTAPILNKEAASEDITDNVISLFAFKNSAHSSAPPTPHEESFVELSRLAGLLADLVEPMIDRYRLTTVDLESERTYLAQMQERLDELTESTERAYSKALSISGVS